MVILRHRELPRLHETLSQKPKNKKEEKVNCKDVFLQLFWVLAIQSTDRKTTEKDKCCWRCCSQEQTPDRKLLAGRWAQRRASYYGIYFVCLSVSLSVHFLYGGENNLQESPLLLSGLRGPASLPELSWGLAAVFVWSDIHGLKQCCLFTFNKNCLCFMLLGLLTLFYKKKN